MEKLRVGFHSYSFKSPLKKTSFSLMFGIEVAGIADIEQSNKVQNSIIFELF